MQDAPQRGHVALTRIVPVSSKYGSQQKPDAGVAGSMGVADLTWVAGSYSMGRCGAVSTE